MRRRRGPGLGFFNPTSRRERSRATRRVERRRDRHNHRGAPRKREAFPSQKGLFARHCVELRESILKRSRTMSAKASILTRAERTVAEEQQQARTASLGRSGQNRVQSLQPQKGKLAGAPPREGYQDHAAPPPPPAPDVPPAAPPAAADQTAARLRLRHGPAAATRAHGK